MGCKESDKTDNSCIVIRNNKVYLKVILGELNVICTSSLPTIVTTQAFLSDKKISLQLDLKVCRSCLKIASGHVLLWASLVAQTAKNLPEMQETWGQIPGLVRSPGEGNGYPL